MASRKNNEYKMLNSPIKWVGGKSRLRKQIIELIPPHTCYVEPFSGAAWVLFGKSPSNVEVLNDVDQDLIRLHLVLSIGLFLVGFDFSSPLGNAWSYYYFLPDYF